MTITNRKKVELIGAQGLLPAANKTTEQPFDRITKHTITNKFINFQPAKNLEPVLESIKEYLQQIAENPGSKRKAALTVAKADANFGVVLTKAPELTIEQRIKQTHKMNSPKPNYN